MSRGPQTRPVFPVIILALLLASPAIAESSTSGDFPDRTFSVMRSAPGGPLTVEIRPQATGEWWVTADAVAGTFITVSLYREDAGALVLESSFKFSKAGDASPRTLLTAGASYRATFTQVGKEGTSVLREKFAWVRQFGTATSDAIYDIAADDSFVYATGRELGNASLRKFDAGGAEMWTRRFPDDNSLGVAFALAVDGTGVYVTGIGALIPGESGYIFLRKYSFDGDEQWTRLISTGSTDNTGGVAANGTGVYVAGWTFGTFPGQSSAGDGDAYVRKYDPAGQEMWTRQFGTSAFDAAYGIHAGPSGVYVVGGTTGVLAGEANAGDYDAFVRKFDSEGNAVWTRQFGAGGSDYPTAVDVEGSGVYVVGLTGTIQNAGGYYTDAFVRKFDPDGNETWNRQFGSDYLYGHDEAFGVDADETGVYVAGWTDGTLPGQFSSGSADAFVRKYDPEGNESWTRQFGTSGYDVEYDIVLRRDGVEALGVYVAGRTDGAFPGQANAGFDDAFLGRLLP